VVTLPPGAVEVFGVDAFTATAFAGNPAAVVPLAAWPEDAWMQAVAAEMNLSETAFLVPASSPATWELRWFTPTVEVDLCGHATLASAHVLWETGQLAPSAAPAFDTRSGRLGARRIEADWIELDLPALPATVGEAPDGLLAALRLTPGLVVAVGRSRMDVLVEVASEADVAAVQPDFAALAAVATRGVIVTAAADDDGVDLVSRFFAPAAGVDEDPVTGSAHCVLGPWWSTRLGRPALVARQISRRGGELRLLVAPDRVGVAGRAVTVLRGQLLR
jgi:PhzF family phenazine biosynthesis protein